MIVGLELAHSNHGHRGTDAASIKATDSHVTSEPDGIVLDMINFMVKLVQSSELDIAQIFKVSKELHGFQFVLSL